MTWLFSSPSRMQMALLMFGDLLLGICAFLAGIYFRFDIFTDGIIHYDPVAPKIAFFTFTLFISSFFLELYNQEMHFGKKEKLVRIMSATVLSFFLLSAFFYMFPFMRVWRGSLLISISIFLILQSIWHIVFKACIHLPSFAKRILVLGTGPTAERIGNIVSSKYYPYVFTGYINCATEPITVPAYHIVNNGESIFETIRNNRPHKIVISLTERRGILPIKEILKCKLSGIDVLDAPSFYEKTTGKLLIEAINPSWFIFSDGFKTTPFKRFFKRTSDILFALIGLLFALPLFPLISLLIKVDSPGPILFKQKRLGENEKHFLLYKFRTMQDNAESRSGPVWTQENDPRITKVGSVLRKTRLDELPQLYNVFKGNMSLIGPRPERPEFIEKLKEIIPYYSERHFAKPGITGWAQIKYPYGASVEDALEKLRYDLYYVKNISISLDLLIFFETIKIVLFGRGSR
jgi:sugar transferase (PEP-CTERM system associated)